MKKRRSLTPRAMKARRSLRKESGYHRVRPPSEAPREPAYASVPPPAPAPEPRKTRDSHVRLCAVSSPHLGRIDEVEAQDVLEDLAEEAQAIEARLDRLERAAVSLESHARPRPDDATSVAAFEALDACFAEMRQVRRALVRVREIGDVRRAHHLFVGDVADYLRGLCAWLHATLDAMDQLVAELWAGSPEYVKYRSRIQAAKNLHFDELEAPLLARLASSHLASGEPVLAKLRVAVEELVYMTRRLDVQLETPVGA